MQRRTRRSAAGWLGWALVLVLAPSTPGACTTRDCAEEREGTVRCVGNQLERCVDGNVLYEPCAPRGLICSEDRQGCVLKDVGDGGGGAGGTPGTGGSGGGS